MYGLFLWKTKKAITITNASQKVLDEPDLKGKGIVGTF